VEAYIYDRLALDPKVFFHVLLINLPAEQIKRLYIRQPSAQNLEIERTGTGGEDWRILRPAGRTYTDRGDFNRLIQALLAIQPAKTVPAPARAEDYGFEPVYFMKIEVYGAGQDPQSVIYLGKRDEAGDYYATQIGQAYFMISKDLVAAFIATVDKLRGPSPGT
jgi:hypothetical protein